MRRTTVLVALVALAGASRPPRLDPDEAMAASRDWSGWPSGRALFARATGARSRGSRRSRAPAWRPPQAVRAAVARRAAPPRRRAAPPRARWVRLPKCGTTFLNTFFSHLCPESARRARARARARPRCSIPRASRSRSRARCSRVRALSRALSSPCPTLRRRSRAQVRAPRRSDAARALRAALVGRRARQQSCVFTSQSIVRLYNDECAPRARATTTRARRRRARAGAPRARVRRRCAEQQRDDGRGRASFRLYSRGRAPLLPARRCTTRPSSATPSSRSSPPSSARPTSELLSAWFYGKHLWGAMPSWETKIARAASTPRQFAEFPGVARATPMLQNCGCSSHVLTAAEVASENAERERPARPSSLRAGIHRCGGARARQAPVARAARRARARRVLAFRFVGITELWRASVCLWHRRVGAGAPRARTAVRAPAAAARRRRRLWSASRARARSVQRVDGSRIHASERADCSTRVDREDELVYAAAALRRFARATSTRVELHARALSRARTARPLRRRGAAAPRARARAARGRRRARRAARPRGGGVPTRPRAAAASAWGGPARASAPRPTYRYWRAAPAAGASAERAKRAARADGGERAARARARGRGDGYPAQISSAGPAAAPEALCARARPLALYRAGGFA